MMNNAIMLKSDNTFINAFQYYRIAALVFIYLFCYFVQ